MPDQETPNRVSPERRKARYLLSEGQMLGAVSTLLLYALLSKWWAIGYALTCLVVWTVWFFRD